MNNVIHALSKWDIVLVLITLTSFIKVFVDISKQWVKSVTELNVTVKKLSEYVEDLRESGRKNHKAIYNKIEKNTKDIENHEVRISVLEQKVDDK